MEDDKTSKPDKPQTAQGSLPSTLTTEGQLKDDKAINKEGKTSSRNQKSSNSMKPWRVKETLKKWWDFIKSPDFTNPAVSVATIVIAVATVYTYREISSASIQTDQIIATQKKIANLQYVAGSPNLRVNKFTLHHTPDGKVWGWVRVQNDGKIAARDVFIAAKMDFREDVPTETEMKATRPLVPGDVSPLHYFLEDNLDPGQRVSSIEAGRKPLSPQEYQKYKGGSTEFRVWGVIHYRDVGNNIEERTFCRHLPKFLALVGGDYGEGQDCGKTPDKTPK
jgi:hypothetical protein